MQQFAKIMMIMGAGLLVLGGLIYLAGKLGMPLGRLPGDFRFESSGVTCVFPLATSIIVSVLLTVGLNLIVRFLNK